ncbi:17-beta-hydroxysteroid dehydrogenase 13 isoform X1 [Zeugodacus cucurbitae]|nr:17-beta-hydroxysteroid dehydrogenase 13 isoform X1 [Zeugodacus cucurbitae]
MVSENLHKIIAWIFVLIIEIFIYPILIVVSWIVVHIDNNRHKEEKSIKGDVAVVTGSAGGLGKCIADELAAKGCHVAICDINYDLAVTTAKEIADKYGVKTKAYKVDVSNYDEIVELNEKVTSDIGTTTILVNNAGLLLHSNQLNPTVQEIKRMINVNYMSHFWTNRVFLENMKRAKKGHIVAICSVAGIEILPQSEPYCSTKIAIRTLMRVLRAELKFNGFQDIRLMTVYPYFMKTNPGIKSMSETGEYPNLYPILGGEEVAKKTVASMLRGEVEIAIPGFLLLTYRMQTLLPQRFQDWMLTKIMSAVTKEKN